MQQYRFIEKGEISVFLALLCGTVCGLILIIFQSAKINSIKVQAQGVTDIALRSAFSEYCKDLYDNYGIVIVDTTYHGEEGGDASFSNHISAYIYENLLLCSKSDLYNLKLKNVEILQSSYGISEVKDINDLTEEDIKIITDKYNESMLIWAAKIRANYVYSGNKEISVEKQYSLY